MSKHFKMALYEQFARTTKALAHPKRIEIIELLSQGPKAVETIAEQTALGLKNASAQLKELKSAGLVEARKEGRYVYYYLPDQEIIDFWRHLRSFSEKRFAEIQKIAAEAFGGDDELENVNRKTLLTRAKKGEVILLDVRPTDEYDAAHLPYALSIPVSEISKRLKDLPKNKEIVAYCRGAYCFMAKEAVELLRKKGYKAIRLKDSIQDWAKEGFSLASGGLHEQP